MSDAAILGVAGIVVSGIIGPAVAAWLAQNAEVGRFRRDQIAHRRDQLRDLLNDAAVLLAQGPTNLRLLKEAGPKSPDHERATQWVRDVFPVGQRLQLWLSTDHAVVRAYDDLRDELVAAAEAKGDTALEASLSRFEDLRRRFLDEARSILLAPVATKEGPL